MVKLLNHGNCVTQFRLRRIWARNAPNEIKGVAQLATWRADNCCHFHFWPIRWSRAPVHTFLFINCCECVPARAQRSRGRSWKWNKIETFPACVALRWTCGGTNFTISNSDKLKRNFNEMYTMFYCYEIIKWKERKSEDVENSRFDDNECVRHCCSFLGFVCIWCVFTVRFLFRRIIFPVELNRCHASDIRFICKHTRDAVSVRNGEAYNDFKWSIHNWMQRNYCFCCCFPLSLNHKIRNSKSAVSLGKPKLHFRAMNYS